jgi:hypothetical protein
VEGMDGWMDGWMEVLLFGSDTRLPYDGEIDWGGKMRSNVDAYLPYLLIVSPWRCLFFSHHLSHSTRNLLTHHPSLPQSSEHFVDFGCAAHFKTKRIRVVGRGL